MPWLLGARPVQVQNNCGYPLTFKTSYSQGFTTTDESVGNTGFPCPNRLEVFFKNSDVNFTVVACGTAWQTIQPGSTASVGVLPDFMWQYSALVAGSDPPYYLSRQSADAYLGAANYSGNACNNAVPSKCVWWAQPDLLNEAATAASSLLVLDCAVYDPKAPPPEPDTTPVEVYNDCDYAVQLKVAYRIADTDAAKDCIIQKYLTPTERLCVTAHKLIDAGDKVYYGETTRPEWAYGAYIADRPGWNVGQFAAGSYQRANDTLGCPDNRYSPWECQWWAPNCPFCNTDMGINATTPFVVTCEGYDPDADLPQWLDYNDYNDEYGSSSSTRSTKTGDTGGDTGDTGGGDAGSTGDDPGPTDTSG